MSNTYVKNYTFLGANVPAIVPNDAATYDAWSKNDGDCVKAAVENFGYRGFATPVRRAILKALEGAGHKPADNEASDKFAERLIAEGKYTAASFQELVDNAIAKENITFESLLGASGTSRAAVGEQWITQAEAYKAKWDAGESSPERFLAAVQKKVPGATLADPTDMTAVGALIRAYDKAKKDEELL